MFEKPTIQPWLQELAATDDLPLSTDVRSVLAEMHETAAERRFPIVGPQVGRLLYQLTTLRHAMRIFELGSGFGYSTLWFAAAAASGYEIHHTDGSEENSDAARKYLQRAEKVEGVVFHVGDAVEALKSTEGDFDIVFMDIDKEGYAAAYDAFADRVRRGGLVIVDNVLWGGSVAEGETDPATTGIRDYLAKMWADKRYVSSLMPVRDGVAISVRVD